jgi:hypothetical protein
LIRTISTSGSMAIEGVAIEPPAGAQRMLSKEAANLARPVARLLQQGVVEAVTPPVQLLLLANT